MGKGMNLLEREQRLDALRDKALRGDITTDQYVDRALEVLRAAIRALEQRPQQPMVSHARQKIGHGVAGR